MSTQGIPALILLRCVQVGTVRIDAPFQKLIYMGNIGLAVSAINISKKELLLLHLLGAREKETVSGITRLQKLVFLAQQGGLKDDPIPEHDTEEKFRYKSFDYGPFSKELYDYLDQLVDDGLIDRRKVETSSGKERYDYSLSPKGEEILSSTPEALAENDLKVIKGVKILYNETPLFELIDRVYADYPEYAKDSVLK